MKIPIKKSLVLFCIALIVMLPVSFAADINTSLASASDTTPPFIEASIPSVSSSRTITIYGTTEPLAKVDIYVNGMLKKGVLTKNDGVFTFPSVELKAIGSNLIILKAEDAAKNKNEKSFTVTVDETKPVLTATIPTTASQRSVTVTGTVSKESTVEIILAGRTYTKVENAKQFSINVALDDGENTITVRATDKVNNAAEVSGKVFVDTTPLKLIELIPRQGAIFYEGYAVSDISGKTKPFAKVDLYIGDQRGDPEYTTTADSQGNFLFKQVDLEKYSLYLPENDVLGGSQKIVGVSGNTGAGFDTSYNSVTPGSQVLESTIPFVGENKQDVSAVKLYFKLTYEQNSIIEEVNYRIGTCFSGNLDWSIQNMVEYQSPNSLSPERLAEGVELIATVLKLEYIGSSSNASVKSITFDKLDCSSPTIKADERYRLACSILPNKPKYKKPNDDKSLWYIRYDLAKLTGQDNFTTDLWKDLTAQMTFLVKMKVYYTYLDEEGVTQSNMQQVCMPLAYHLDKSRIDPRDVLPDWMQEQGIAKLNQTINQLNQAISVVEKVVKYAAIGCIAGFALKTLAIISRRMAEWNNYLTDKVDTTKKDEDKCPIPLPNLQGYKKGDKTQQDLTNEELQKRCPDAASAWGSESSANDVFRWTCDRFLCRGTPAKWTENVDYEFIRTRMEENAVCNAQTGSEGVVLQKVTDCKDKCTGYDTCYEYKKEYYVYKPGSQPVKKEESGEANYFELAPCGKSGEILSNKKPLYVTVDSGNAFLDQTPLSTRKCLEACKDPGEGKQKWPTGKCMTWEQAQKELIKRFTDQKGAETEVKNFQILGVASDCKSADNEKCYCYTAPEKATGKEAAPGEEWNYRSDKTKQVFYPKFRYYKGRDESACFGQNNIIFQEQAPYLSPSDIVPAFQCVCTTQIRNRLVAFRNILQGLENCLLQIKTTGKADTGVCKEIFTQYVCKWMYTLISWFMKGCASWNGTGKDVGVGDYLTAGTQSIFGGVFESAQDLMSDYDSPSVRNYLGVGDEAIANKICLGALTGNWGFDLEGFVDAAYATPYHTSVQSWPADREYLTWDPDNFQSTYEYRIAWWMTPGCDLTSYSIKLSCINQEVLDTFDGARCEQAVNKNGDETEVNADNPGCDCFKLANEKTTTVYTGRRVSQGQFISENVRKTVKSPYRYDNVKVEVFMADAKAAEKCIPQANRVGKKGVFYFPISDATTYDIVACRFDQMTGQFMCNEGMALWQKRGRAYFGDVKCDDKECKSSDETAYYLGDKITLTPFKAYFADKDQCINIQLFNANNQKLLGEEGMVVDLNVDSVDPSKTQEYNLPLAIKEVMLQDFSSYDMNSRYSIAIPDEIDAQQTGMLEEVSKGAVNVYIHSLGNNTNEYYMTKYDNASREIVLSNWQNLDFNKPLNINGLSVNIFKVSMPTDSNSCQGLGADSRLKPCKKYVFEVKEKSISSSTLMRDQRWKIHMELRHAPGEENEGSCYDSTTEDIITYQGVKQVKDLYIKANPVTMPACVKDGKVCRGVCQYYVGGTKEAASKQGCSAGKYCCETDLNVISTDLQKRQATT